MSNPVELAVVALGLLACLVGPALHAPGQDARQPAPGRRTAAVQAGIRRRAKAASGVGSVT